MRAEVGGRYRADCQDREERSSIISLLPYQVKFWQEWNIRLHFFVDTPFLKSKSAKLKHYKTALTLILKVIWRHLGLIAKSVLMGGLQKAQSGHLSSRPADGARQAVSKPCPLQCVT